MLINTGLTRWPFIKGQVLDFVSNSSYFSPHPSSIVTFIQFQLLISTIKLYVWQYMLKCTHIIDSFRNGSQVSSGQTRDHQCKQAFFFCNLTSEMYSRSMQSCYHKPSANAPSNAHKHSQSQCSQMSEYRREVNCQKLIQILFGYLLMQHDQNGPGITIFKSILLREITQNETVLRCKGWLIEVQKRGNCKTVKHSRNWQLFFFQHPFPDPNHQLNTHFTCDFLFQQHAYSRHWLARSCQPIRALDCELRRGGNPQSANQIKLTIQRGSCSNVCKDRKKDHQH